MIRIIHNNLKAETIDGCRCRHWLAIHYELRMGETSLTGDPTDKSVLPPCTSQAANRNNSGRQSNKRWLCRTNRNTAITTNYDQSSLSTSDDDFQQLPRRLGRSSAVNTMILVYRYLAYWYWIRSDSTSSTSIPHRHFIWEGGGTVHLVYCW